MAISNSASPEIIWGLGGPEEDHPLHHCCWTGRVSEREEEDYPTVAVLKFPKPKQTSLQRKIWIYDKGDYVKYNDKLRSTDWSIQI